jgi:hypothetical protein
VNTGLENDDADHRRLIVSLRQSLDMTYARMLETAREKWELNFAGQDPSDACVSVRIGSGGSQRLPLPCAGILRRGRRSLLNGNGHPSLA